MNLRLLLCIIVIISLYFTEVQSRRPRTRRKGPGRKRIRVNRGKAKDKCTYIVTIPNGGVTYEDPNKLNHIGKYVTFHCDRGFKLDGVQKTYCNPETRTWNDPTPQCQEWKCRELVGLKNGLVQYTNSYYNLPGGIAKYKCNYGYRLKGESSITCQDNAEWDSSEPECESDQCPPIVYFNHGRVRKYNRLRGSVVKFVCDTYYTPSGPESSECSQVGLNLEWSPPVPSCTSDNPLAIINGGIQCPRIIDIPNAKKRISRGDGTEIRSRVDIKCQKGYIIKGSTSRYTRITCQADGMWGTIPVCEDIRCDPFQVIANGRVRYHTNAYIGSRISVSCNVGYKKIGKRHPQCMANHKWDSYPTCDKYQCPDLLYFEHGYISGYSNEVGKSFRYRCDKGYQLRGKRHNKCKKPKPEWINDHPKCVLENGACVAHGDPHFRGYDGQKITFMGTCKYTLSSTNGKAAANGLEEFNVEAKHFQPKEGKAVSFVRYVTVDIGQYRIQMGPGRDVIVGKHIVYKGESHMVGGVKVNLPVMGLPGAPGVRIKLSGRFVELITAFGLEVRKDEYHKAVINIPYEYSGIVCGICGNFNSDRSDDLLTKEGKSIAYTEINAKGKPVLTYHWAELGNSFEIPGIESEPGCLSYENPQPKCDAVHLEQVQNVCGLIIDPNSNFAECVNELGLQAVEEDYHSCTYDACMVPDPTQVMCDTLTDLADKCTEQEIYIQWRTETFCPLDCPVNSVYKPMTSACPKSCGNLDEEVNNCSEDPVEGCECITDYVLNSDGHCIHKSECGCTNDQGFYYPVGDSYPADDCTGIYVCQHDGTFRHDAEPPCHQHATCVNQDGLLGCHCKDSYEGDGVSECKSIIPPATCIAAGDPFFTRYDGSRFEFQGRCEYVLSQPCNDDSWYVYVENMQTETGQRTYPHRIHVYIHNHLITLSGFTRVLVDGEQKSVPFDMSSVPLSVTLGTGNEAGAVLLTAANYGLKVSFDGRGLSGRHVAKVTMSNSDYFGKLCGLCGNWNNNIVDDDYPKGKTETGTADEVGQSWRTDTPCPADVFST